MEFELFSFSLPPHIIYIYIYINIYVHVLINWVNTKCIDFHIVIIHIWSTNYLYQMILYVYFHKFYIKITIDL